MLKLASGPSALETPEAVTASSEAPSSRRMNGLAVFYVEPLDDDQPSDVVITISHRQLSRLILIAAETGCRFEREGSTVDPLAWLYSPRELFHGLPAVQACQERLPFLRAVVLHSLSIGLDVNPDEIDDLLNDDDKDRGCTAMPATHRRKAITTGMSLA